MNMILILFIISIGTVSQAYDTSDLNMGCTADNMLELQMID